MHGAVYTMTQQQPRQRYSWRIDEGWSSDCDGNNYHMYEVIAYDIEQVDKWLKETFNLEKYDASQSDYNQITYLIDTIYDEEGEEVKEIPEDKNSEDYNIISDYVTATRDEEPITKNNLEYLKSGKYHCQVVDLTEKSN